MVASTLYAVACFFLIAASFAEAACSFSDTVKIAEKLYDAENSILSPRKNLFVTGGDNLYYIPTGQPQIPLLDENTYMLGMSFIQSRLYAVSESDLYVSIEHDVDSVIASGRLPSFQKIHTFGKSVSLPNGVATDGLSRLWIADSQYDSLISGGQVLVVTLDETGNVSLVEQAAAKPMVMHPNGLKYQDGKLFATDIGKIVRLDVDPASGRATAASEVFHLEETMFDDIAFWSTPDGTELLGVCDIFRGSVFLLDMQDWKIVAESGRESFHGPSSLLQWSANKMLVTNKGIVREHDYNWGDYVTTTSVNCSATSR
eukprot:ANDGO_00925.mRNA.1 hypothetical protein CAOG_03122